ncbi:hypothetical protein KAR91_08920 [Candidatus Pacearchaeota archaeon]|nr:hypothetical protein [Candidatus Pacearchaeota archaeon]
MILFLRDKKNNTVVDIELYKTEGHIELSVFIDIAQYSKLLLTTPKEKQLTIITIFNFLSELRGWLWESHFGGRKNTAEEFDEVLDKVRETLAIVAEYTDLHRVED